MSCVHLSISVFVPWTQSAKEREPAHQLPESANVKDQTTAQQVTHGRQEASEITTTAEILVARSQPYTATQPSSAPNGKSVTL